MPPRLTPRKFFLTFLVVIGVTLLVGSQYRFSYFSGERSRQADVRVNNAPTQKPNVDEVINLTSTMLSEVKSGILGAQRRNGTTAY